MEAAAIGNFYGFQEDSTYGETGLYVCLDASLQIQSSALLDFSALENSRYLQIQSSEFHIIGVQRSTACSYAESRNTLAELTSKRVHRGIELQYSGDLPGINVERPRCPTYFPVEEIDDIFTIIEDNPLRRRGPDVSVRVDEIFE